MNRTQKILRNIVLLVILLLIFLKSTGLYLTPLSAHRNSERSVHYGPSEIIHIEDFDKGKYILCKYDRWISCNTVNRELFFFWSFGNQVTGPDIDSSEAITSSWSLSDDNQMVYGIINDDTIVRVDLQFGNGDVYTQTEFYDEDMFLFALKTDRDGPIKLRGYDQDDHLIFENPY